MYASLSDSYEWKHLNSGGALDEKILKLIKTGEHVSPNRIPTAMLQIKNKLKSILMPDMLEAMEDGDLVLIYEPNIKIPIYLPFIVTAPGPHRRIGYVFINNLDASDTGEEIMLNARKLKVSMESCFISMKLNLLGESPKTKTTAIIRTGSKIYSGIIAECINRKHSTKLDLVCHNSIIYTASMYYIYTILGCKNLDEETLRNYCLYNCKSVDYIQLERVIGQFKPEDYVDISTYIKRLMTIDELHKRLAKLNITNFLESFINMYDASMLLGLEVFSYLLYNIISVNESTYVNNYQLLKNIVGEDGKKLYADVAVTASTK